MRCWSFVFGELLLRLHPFRSAAGILFNRGHLLAFAQGHGVYEADLRRTLVEWRYANGIDEKDRHAESHDNRLVLRRLILDAVARSLAAREKISTTKIESELKLLQRRFRDEKIWRAALRKNGLSVRSLRGSIVNDLRSREWIEQQMTSQGDATEDECQNFYDTHPQNFLQRARFRASHVFLAAPLETPPDVVETKQKTINSLAARIKQGEKLADVAIATSEDEATKTRGGDLGFFSESRMPLDFFYAVVEMHVGEISQPIRTRLGFHIVEVTDFKPARQMSFEEVQPEIRFAIKNEKRRAALQSLTRDLLRRAKPVRPL